MTARRGARPVVSGGACVAGSIALCCGAALADGGIAAMLGTLAAALPLAWALAPERMPARAVDVALDRVIDRPPDPRPEPAPWTARPAASQLPARGYALKAV